MPLRGSSPGVSFRWRVRAALPAFSAVALHYRHAAVRNARVDLVAQGMTDLREGRETVPALPVSIGAARLRAPGLDVPAPLSSPEHELCRRLCGEDEDAAHSRDEPLMPRLASVERAMACARWLTRDRIRVVAQRPANTEREHGQVDDVRAMLARDLVTPDAMRAAFEAIEPRLNRDPAIDPRGFRRAVESVTGGAR